MFVTAGPIRVGVRWRRERRVCPVVTEMEGLEGWEVIPGSPVTASGC